MGQAAFTSLSAPSPKTQLTTPSLLCRALRRVLGFVPTRVHAWEEVNTPRHSSQTQLLHRAAAGGGRLQPCRRGWQHTSRLPRSQRV